MLTSCPTCKADAVVVVDRKHSWKASHRDPSGRIRSRSFAQRRDAEAFLAAVTHSVYEKRYRDPDRGRELFGDYLRARIEKSPKLSPSTRHLYRIEADRYILPALGRAPIRELDPTGLQAFLDDLASQTGARTVEVVHRIISGTLARAVHQGLIASNPAARLELARPSKRPIRVLRPEEVEAVAGEVDARYRAFVLVAAYGALRFGEAAGIRVRDLDLLRKRLIISGAVVQVGSDVQRTDRTKTDGSLRQVVLPGFLVEELAAHLARFEVREPDALRFTAPVGGPLSRTVFRNRVWVPACERLGWGEYRTTDGKRRFSPGVRFHDLRHAGVALAIKANAHPKTIQSWVGHSSIKTTMDVYGHLYDDAHEDLAAGLDELHSAALADQEATGQVVGIGS